MPVAAMLSDRNMKPPIDIKQLGCQRSDLAQIARKMPAKRRVSARGVELRTARLGLRAAKACQLASGFCLVAGSVAGSGGRVAQVGSGVGCRVRVARARLGQALRALTAVTERAIGVAIASVAARASAERRAERDAHDGNREQRARDDRPLGLL